MNNREVTFRATILAEHLVHKFGGLFSRIKLYGVPRGGIPAAYVIASQNSDRFEVVDDVEDAHVVIDDIIDSGATREKYKGRPFYALVDKTSNPDLGWVVFPWEATAESGIEDHVTRILQFIGGDSNQEYFKTATDLIVKSLKMIKDSA